MTLKRRRRNYDPRSARRRRLGRLVFATTLFCSGFVAIVCARAIARVRPVAITVGQATVIIKKYPDHHANARQQIHEAIHRLQYRETGMLRFLAAYLFDQDQRLAWEAEALAATLCYSRAREAYRIDQLSDAAIQGLELYWVAGKIPRRLATKHLDHAYRDGEACPALSRRIANATGGLVYVFRPTSAAAD